MGGRGGKWIYNYVTHYHSSSFLSNIYFNFKKIAIVYFLPLQSVLVLYVDGCVYDGLSNKFSLTGIAQASQVDVTTVGSIPGRAVTTLLHIGPILSVESLSGSNDTHVMGLRPLEIF